MIRIGIIGMSPGNAHPYSWSAIINGSFDGDEISKVGYPAVSHYLQANSDTLGISNARVTHVWTQEHAISESIARSSNIEHVVSNLEDMIGQVEAVILSRDDPENHVAMAKPFIDAGIPIFIDKPLAISLGDLAYFSEECAKGKLIISCSSMRYANECRIVKQELAQLGKLELVVAVGKKDWVKYGVHLLEALFALLDDPRPVSVKHIGTTGKDIVHLEFENEIRAVLNLFGDIVPTFQISLFGRQGWRLIDIKNSYSMFRDNIIEFIRSVEENRSRLSFDKTENIIRTLIGAQASLEHGGKAVDLQSERTK
ncbi:MAG: Gfo/Idh/MocA family oxidoreductase [Cytophagales bacterium]|nr:Gfo/Idh/MocA family oxidoreductase [Cytophagales bacterium]